LDFKIVAYFIQIKRKRGAEMREIATALENARSIDEFVEIINDEVDDCSRDTLAAESAYGAYMASKVYEACEASGAIWMEEKYDEKKIDSYLEILKENGAYFDYQAAKKLAISYIEEML
jgi:hypothetical protein